MSRKRSGSAVPNLQESVSHWWWALFAVVLLVWSARSDAVDHPVSPAEEYLRQQVREEEYLRQQAREQEIRERNEPNPDVRPGQQPAPEAGRLPDQESPCFEIKQITLNGEDADRFQWALGNAFVNERGDEDLVLPRCIGGASINVVMRRIQNEVISRGYITTRILAQPQDLNSGELALTVVPGRIRHIRMADESQGKAGFRHALPIREGAILNLRDLEQALENFRRVPTAQANFQIVPATEKTAQPGESDILVEWHQSTPLRATFSVDDSGSETTGKYLGNVTVSADNWLSMNDLFYVNYTEDLGGGLDGDRGTQGHTVHYSFPIGYWLFAITGSENDYHQSVAGLNQSYEYSGESSNGELRLSRLMYRDAVRKTTLSFGGWTRSSRNYIDDTEVEVQRRRMAGWMAGVGHSEYIGAALLDANLDYRRGTGAHDALQAPEELFGEGTSRPEIILLNARLNLPFIIGDQRMRWNALWRAQWNRTPLVPQDNFSIGGRYTVRGFDGERVLAADRGWLVRNDLGWRVFGHQEIYLGIDYGQVSGDDADRLVGTHLGGAVMGIRGSYRWIAYDLFAGTHWDKPDEFVTEPNVTGFNISIGF